MMSSAADVAAGGADQGAWLSGAAPSTATAGSVARRNLRRSISASWP